MAVVSQRYPLDFRRGGDTVHDFAAKYIGEVPFIYDALDSVRGNKESPKTLAVMPTASQWYVDIDGNIYMRSLDNNVWNFIGKNKPYMGMKDADDDGAFLTESSVSKDGTGEGKIPCINGSDLIVGSITGNAGKLGGYTVDMKDVRDGQVLAFSAAENKIVAVNRLQTGDGNITFSRSKPTDGSFWICPM